jgi:nucleoside-diphosphate-sugar epimerase
MIGEMVAWRAIHGDWFAGRRVLVTGGAGFIGSHLVEALAALGAEVVVLDDLSGGSWENLSRIGGAVEKITGSITESAVVERAVRGCEFVFHEAALGSVPQSIEQPLQYFDVNVNGTLNVLRAAQEAGVKRVVYAGSSSAYGDTAVSGAKVETMPPLPRSPYAAAKLAGEHAMRAWWYSYGLDTAVLRYFNIFGPRQSPASAYAAVIAAFAKAFMERRAATIYGDGKQSRDFTYVANVVHANLLSARHERALEGEVFNVAMGGKIDLNELHRRMAAIFGAAGSKAEYESVRAGDVYESQADVSKAKTVLGYDPVVGFEEGLAETVKWYRENLK